ncbi:hypothetical protein QNA08_12650 [Chelatococcus sp. SYSU_G07232]|uniref:Ubiquitin-activating enzyme E1 FCCH domain-containing protein n=1 Tax=Chelatococcus albus TaxID=3047466 RepID=A0ABT7AKE4_9HYPH|nr:hypothetical protein [Chelatococcus sp. SYSU_G07232]MDJ1159086.1 hypothetical protein [Chelatococcus sp. SYSU_G07232]
MTLTISLSPATLSALSSGGFSLYAFRSVESSNRSGAPLVWQRFARYTATTTVTVGDQVYGYDSTDPITVNGTVRIGSSTGSPVVVSQVLTVDTIGTISVANGGPPDTILFDSTAEQRYTCGLAAPLDSGNQVPYCAFDLYAMSVPVAPLRAVFVMFATSVYDPGTYMATSLAQGLYVDFADADAHSVAFDMTTGWSAGSAAWAKVVAPNTSMQGVLIRVPPHNRPKY